LTDGSFNLEPVRKVDAVVSSNIGADSGVEICELKVVTDGVSADADGETALTN